MEDMNHGLVFSSSSVNFDYMKKNIKDAHVKIRNFTFHCNGKEYHAFLVVKETKVSPLAVNSFVLSPLMLKHSVRDNNIANISISNNVGIKKILKYDLEKKLMNSLLPVLLIEKKTKFEEIINEVLNGKCLLFVDTIACAFSIDLRDKIEEEKKKHPSILLTKIAKVRKKASLFLASLTILFLCFFFSYQNYKSTDVSAIYSSFIEQLSAEQQSIYQTIADYLKSTEVEIVNGTPYIQITLSDGIPISNDEVLEFLYQTTQVYQADIFGFGKKVKDQKNWMELYEYSTFRIN